MTAALHWPALADCVISPGQLIAQPPAALLTVTVKLQVAVLLAGSLAVQFTVVVPTGNAVPDGGMQVIVTQLPVVVGDG